MGSSVEADGGGGGLSREKLISAAAEKKPGERVRFFVAAGGIFICYFYYGILQESITKTLYPLPDSPDDDHGNNAGGEKKYEKFTYTLSLVSVQCVVNAIYAQAVLHWLSPRRPSDAVVDWRLYGACALTYLLAMVSSNLSLQWVPYPTQVIGKSCKPIPVMLLGVLLGGRSYALRKYLYVLLIVVGVALFMYKPQMASTSTSTSTSSGELLLLMSLAMDGLTGAIQERMRSAGKSRPNSAHMMRQMNLFSVAYTVVALVIGGEMFTFPAFVARQPQVAWRILLFSLMSALGQFFIYMMVSEFGPLPCSVVTTTRKFFTVMASVLIFGNVLLAHQWMGAICVFAGLGLDAAYGGK